MLKHLTNFTDFIIKIFTKATIIIALIFAVLVLLIMQLWPLWISLAAFHYINWI